MAVAARNVCHHLQERDCSHRHVSLAIVHNLHEVPPVPGHLSRQDNHSLHKWAASTCSAGQRWVEQTWWDHPKQPDAEPECHRGTMRHGGAVPNAAYCQTHSSRHGVREPNTPQENCCQA